MFWKKKPVKPFEPFFKGVVEENKITVLCKSAECDDLIKLLKFNRDSIMQTEMLDLNSKSTLIAKGQVLAYNQLIANISEIRKEEIVYARKSE